MKKFLITVLLFSLVTNLAVSQTKEEKKELKEAKAKKEYEEISALVNSGKFAYRADWAFPLGGGRINLQLNPNVFKMSDGIADVFFPYFGVVHRGGGYNGNVGIEFDGPVEKYKISFDDKKRRITIKFNARRDTESFDITMKISRSGNTSIIVNSSNRETIKYDGELIALEKEE